MIAKRLGGGDCKQNNTSNEVKHLAHQTDTLNQRQSRKPDSIAVKTFVSCFIQHDKAAKDELDDREQWGGGQEKRPRSAPQ